MDLVCADPRSMHGHSSSCRHKSVCLLVATVPVFVSRYGASTISRWQRLWSSPCLCRLWRRWQWQNQPWRHPTPPTGLSYCWWDDVQFNKNTISTFEWIKILKVNGFYFVNGFYKAYWLSYGFNCSLKLIKLLKNYCYCRTVSCTVYDPNPLQSLGKRRRRNSGASCDSQTKDKPTQVRLHINKKTKFWFYYCMGHK